MPKRKILDVYEEAISEAQREFEKLLAERAPIVVTQGKIDGERQGIRQILQSVNEYFRKEKGRTLTFHQMSEAFRRAARKLNLLPQ